EQIRLRLSVLKPDTTPGPGDDGYEGYNNSKKVPCIGKLRKVFGEDCADAYESQSRSNENGNVWTFACIDTKVYKNHYQRHKRTDHSGYSAGNVNFSPCDEAIAKRDHEEAGNGLIPHVLPGRKFCLAANQQKRDEDSARNQLPYYGKKERREVLDAHPHGEVGRSPYQTYRGKGRIGSKGIDVLFHSAVRCGTQNFLLIRVYNSFSFIYFYHISFQSAVPHSAKGGRDGSFIPNFFHPPWGSKSHTYRGLRMRFHKLECKFGTFRSRVRRYGHGK